MTFVRPPAPHRTRLLPNYAIISALTLTLTLALALPPHRLVAQAADARPAEVLSLPRGQAMRISAPRAIGKVTIANPEVANVVVTGTSNVVINANSAGSTDVFLLTESGDALRHLRITVTEETRAVQQVYLGVKFAEVRSSTLRQIAASFAYADPETRAGMGALRPAPAGEDRTPGVGKFFGAVSTFNSRDLLGLIEAEVQRGNARFLAEPTLTAAMGEQASFLAGGEFPIPLVQGGAAGQQAFVTIQFREFGVRLSFKPISATDSLLRLFVKPEVSSLDYGNAITLQGFQVPALRTRRVESTVEVFSDRSLIISGLFNEEREQVKTGIPLLMDIPLLGTLFSSRRWLSSESELIVIVTPMLADAKRPPAAVSPAPLPARTSPLAPSGKRPPARP